MRGFGVDWIPVYRSMANGNLTRLGLAAIAKDPYVTPLQPTFRTSDRPSNRLLDESAVQ